MWDDIVSESSISDSFMIRTTYVSWCVSLHEFTVFTAHHRAKVRGFYSVFLAPILERSDATCQTDSQVFLRWSDDHPRTAQSSTLRVYAPSVFDDVDSTSMMYVVAASRVGNIVPLVTVSITVAPSAAYSVAFHLEFPATAIP